MNELARQFELHEKKDEERFTTIDSKLANLPTKEDFMLLNKRLDPAVRFLSTLDNVNRFLKWGGLSIFAALAILYYLIKPK